MKQYEQQRTWLRLYTNPLDLWSLAHLQESQFPRGLGEDWQEFTSCGCEKQGTGAYQGAKYFSYNGKVLDEIRKEKENIIQ